MGWDWGKFFGGVGRIAPLVSVFAGPAAPIVLGVSRAILDVEAAIAAPGATKRAKAIEIVGALVEAGEGLSGRDLVSDPLIHEATLAIIDCEVALRNAHAALDELVADFRLKAANPQPPDPPTDTRPRVPAPTE